MSTGVKIKTYTKEIYYFNWTNSWSIGSESSKTIPIVADNLLQYDSIYIYFSGRDSYQWTLALTFDTIDSWLIIARNQQNTGSFETTLDKSSYVSFFAKWIINLLIRSDGTWGYNKTHTLYNFKVIGKKTVNKEHLGGLPRKIKDIWLYSSITIYWIHIDNTFYTGE